MRKRQIYLQHLNNTELEKEAMSLMKKHKVFWSWLFCSWISYTRYLKTGSCSMICCCVCCCPSHIVSSFNVLVRKNSLGVRVVVQYWKMCWKQFQYAVFLWMNFFDNIRKFQISTLWIKAKTEKAIAFKTYNSFA